ncbi:Predicted ATP-dependent endonuclease of the OLD family, contains P-loop ATPase and TOPRIM domains [Hymenobacter daecheongensis DSM 21074]|uniref:Predicted ATP-dependent endonuclease of the OLD family, contains P-loop ATPase and TOPRIM domains n=1 Tax=Hymenobacter daecheongensis DSM 21074 TaxID=1121955 RepID=A0A1M6EXY0_9BACT|nr:AAA family ATPase [Hymenobacter daecheongensis]SHI90283.1 Predicted ATP-dependent endonuclease of the OLD family, contains P-loop ATPase and TOPRIM domains [Hymenobacter daecheongensis DSM 21074]
MYISKLQIVGFRNFKDSEVVFNDGVNVIIGHNNAGKTNLVKALSLVVDYKAQKRLNIDDFYKHIGLDDLKKEPPKISIQLTISQSISKPVNSDDLVTVSSWLTKLSPPYEALLTYEFFLPEKDKSTYIADLSAVTDVYEAWSIIEHDFLRYYVYKIFGGDIKLQVTADGESLQKFDFQFLDAIRDIERDMLTGKSSLLKEVLDFFMDYDIKSDTSKDAATRNLDVRAIKKEFSKKSSELYQELQKRMDGGKNHILSYAKETGAAFGKAIPTFEGSISDVEMFSALRLIVEYETGIKIPASHNGLGYNNLIYISLLLAKMQVNSDGNYLGSNAKVFPLLVIEEPEAHLHPAMQYKFLKFLKDNKDVDKKVRQVFVTSHSTQITSAVSLDEIICISNVEGLTQIGYPGKVFPNTKEGQSSKAYVQRFLDATKSDMLFAQKIILVEGIAEQLLMSTLAKYCCKSLEDNHVAVINVGGRFFDHFLYLFDKNTPHTIHKTVACLTDRDPVRRKKPDGSYMKCYPYEMNEDVALYDYQQNASASIAAYGAHPNIRFFSQDVVTGKTFEYDIVMYNPSLELLLTESVANSAEITQLMQLYASGDTVVNMLALLRNSGENIRIKNIAVLASSWNDNDKKIAIIASRLLNSVGKGQNAFELSQALEENFNAPTPFVFKVPKYVKEAINWVCQ